MNRNIKLYIGSVAIITVFSVFSVLISCDHKSSDSTSKSEDLSFSGVVSGVFPSCSACHLNGNVSGGLDLSVYENLYNVNSSGNPLYKLIKPASPESSYIYMKITGIGDIVGSTMPVGSTLAKDKIDFLKRWIEAGAHKNGTGKNIPLKP